VDVTDYYSGWDQLELGETGWKRVGVNGTAC
jgi:hypothetical protein